MSFLYPCGFFPSSFILLSFLSSIVSGRRLDVYHILPHMMYMALVGIQNAGLNSARGSLTIQDAKIRKKITICAPSLVGLYLHN